MCKCISKVSSEVDSISSNKFVSKYLNHSPSALNHMFSCTSPVKQLVILSDSESVWGGVVAGVGGICMFYLSSWFLPQSKKHALDTNW